MRKEIPILSYPFFCKLSLSSSHEKVISQIQHHDNSRCAGRDACWNVAHCNISGKRFPGHVVARSGDDFVS